MGFSQGGIGASSAYPVVSDGMGRAAAGIQIENYGYLGGTSGLHGPAYNYSPMQSHHAVPPSSSSFHFSDGFFDSPGFGGGQRAAPAPVPIGGGYGSGGMVGSGGMDLWMDPDLQASINNDFYETWSRGFELSSD